MTICDICGEIDMTTIGEICRECARECDEWNCPRCGYFDCICSVYSDDDDEESEP